MDTQMADYRDRWLFLSGVAMSWLAVSPVLQRELYALAHQEGEWTKAHARSKLQAVFRTAHRAARGERVEYAGMEVDPRYRFKNQMIIDLLEITADDCGVSKAGVLQNYRPGLGGTGGEPQDHQCQVLGALP